MATLRKFVAYRKLERPYTRYSKYKVRNYVRARPANRIARYDMGNDVKTYDYQLDLIAGADLQIRDRALESARQTSNRHLEENLGKTEYKLKLMVFPHHILRENPLAAGAGADRMSTGMAHAFGKPHGIAAQVKKGKSLFRLFCQAKHLDVAKIAIRKAKYKVPCACKIEIKKIIPPTPKVSA
jgi:large subunit ribosomal protein L10e